MVKKIKSDFQMYHIADFGNMVQEGELMKYKERMLTRNSFSAAYKILDYICDEQPEIDMSKHEKNVQLLLLRCLRSKKQRTRKKCRKKMLEYCRKVMKINKIKIRGE